MDAALIEHWIERLGRPYDSLVAEGLIPALPLEALYEGREWLHIEPADGIELSFFADSKKLVALYIGLLQSTTGTTVYKGELPKPFAPAMTKSGVRATFGDPMESKGPIKMPEPLGQTGGWDAYRLDTSTHPNTRVEFQYTATLAVKVLVFSLIDDHD